MKIGLVLPGFSADERDWCIPALYNFVRTLAVHNEIHVFALEYPYRRRRYNFFGATVHAMNGAHRGKIYAPRLWTNTLSAIFAEHRYARFDRLHAFWVNEAGLLTMIAARVLGMPMIASVAGGELVGLRQIRYGGQLSWIERTMIGWTMKRANLVTVGSRYLQHIAARWRRDVKIAPLGVDTKTFSPVRDIGGPSTEMKILTVGSLARVKQQEVLVGAFARLKLNARLEIVGAGEQEKFLRDYATQLGISQRVKFSGEVAHDALPQKYRAADLFVQPSSHEAQGMAVLEATASGIAIAGTPVGILPELAERRAAITTDGFEANSLTNAIYRAAEQRKELGCRAREIIEKEFSLDVTCARWMDLYNSLN